jgi:Xaa-Pro aminopeptidase
MGVEDTDRGEAILMIASSEADSNLYYATGFLASDPFLYLEIGGEKILLSSELELGRARREARVDRVISTGPYRAKLREEGITPRRTDVIDLYLRERGVNRLAVPANFPLGYAEQLREKGYQLECREGPFYPERLVKRPDEIEKIAAAQKVTEEAMALAVGMIAESRMNGARLLWKGEPLTSEAVQREVRRMLLERGYLAMDIIIACGDQGCDPHLSGSGPLAPNQTIVIDIFPRSLETRYWGDMTRTVVRGKAPDAVWKIYRDVEDAQKLGISLLRDGADGQQIHQQVTDHFTARGHVTSEVNGKMQGFIHGTGHGVGLDIHEPPRISRMEATLQAGTVVSIEPGLYYPGTGAVRLEDLMVVEREGARNLNRFPKVLEI